MQTILKDTGNKVISELISLKGKIEVSGITDTPELLSVICSSLEGCEFVDSFAHLFESALVVDVITNIDDVINKCTSSMYAFDDEIPVTSKSIIEYASGRKTLILLRSIITRFP